MTMTEWLEQWSPEQSDVPWKERDGRLYQLRGGRWHRARPSYDEWVTFMTEEAAARAFRAMYPEAAGQIE